MAAVAATERHLYTLSAQHQTRQIRIAERVSDGVERAFKLIVTDVGDKTQLQFAETAVSIVRAGQLESIELAHAYVSQGLQLAGAPAPKAIRAERLADTLRGGTPLLEVYKRPLVTARRLLSEGQGLKPALAAAQARAVSAADTDTMLAARAGAQDAMQRSSRVVGYRRVPDSGACPFCLLVSTQRYHKERLMPIHPKCHCDVIPIIGSADPGRVIDKERLAGLKAKGLTVTKTNAKGETVKYTYGPDDVAVHEHGELGPVLGEKGQNFTGPDDI